MKEIAGEGASTYEVAEIMGDDTGASSVRRWLNGTRPPADKVIAFGRGYNQNPVVGLVEGGYLDPQEVRGFEHTAKTTEELLAEIEMLNGLPADVQAKLGIATRVADIKAEIERRTLPPPRRPKKKAKQTDAHAAPAEGDVSSTES